MSFIYSQDLFNTGMNPKVSCYRIPALICAKNGALIAAIDERINSCADLNRNDNINIVIRSSKDNGLHWSDIRTLYAILERPLSTRQNRLKLNYGIKRDPRNC